MTAAGPFRLSETAHPMVGAAFAYWRGIRPDDAALPGRQHLDPLHIPHLLPHIWLVDVLRDVPLFAQLLDPLTGPIPSLDASRRVGGFR